MSGSRKWLLGIGIGLVGTMLLISSFSLGVFMGERGMMQEKVQPAGFGGVPAAQQQPAQFAPPDRHQEGDQVPVLKGIVRRLSRDLITVETKDGTKMVQISSDTAVRLTENGEGEGSLDDVKPGVEVAVIGRMDPDERMLRADVIVVFPIPQGK